MLLSLLLFLFSSIHIGVHAQPQSIAVADFTGDGYLDYVYTNAPDNKVSLYTNLKNKSFSETSTGFVNAMYTVAAGDIDGDGDIDFVCGSYFQLLNVYINNGGGTFTIVHLDQFYRLYWGTILVDINGDGKLDILITKSVDTTTSSGVGWYSGFGNTSFSSQPSLIFSGNCSNHGAYLSVIKIGNTLFYGAASGNKYICITTSTATVFSRPSEYLVDTTLGSTRIADINKDGVYEMFCGGGNGCWTMGDVTGTKTDVKRVNLAASSTGVTTESGFSYFSEPVDVNGDTYLDFCVVFQSKVTLAYGCADGNLVYDSSISLNLPSVSYPVCVLADFNNDTKKDIVLAANNGNYVQFASTDFTISGARCPYTGFTIPNVTIVEGSTGNVNVNFNRTRFDKFSMTFSLTGITIASNSISLSSSSATVTPLTNSLQVAVQTQKNTTYTGDLVAKLCATVPSSVVLIASTQVCGYIIISESDPLPSVIVTRALSVTEGSYYIFDFALSSKSSRVTTVQYTMTDDTAIDQINYKKLSGTITFNAYSLTATSYINVTTIRDLVYDTKGGRTFKIVLSNAVGVQIPISQIIANVTNIDPVPVLRVITPAAVDEGSIASVIVYLSGASYNTTRVTFSTTAGTTSNFIPRSNQIVFPALSNQNQTIDFTTTRDNIYMQNTNKVFYVNFTLPFELKIETASTTITVTDIDPMPTMTVSSVVPITVAEGSPITINFSLANKNSLESSFLYSLINADGTLSTAFVNTSQNVTFPALTTEKTLILPTIPDNVYRAGEILKFSILFYSPVQLTIDTFNTSLFIQDTTAVPEMNISSVSSSSVFEGGSIVVNFALSRLSAVSCSFVYTLVDGNGTSTAYVADSKQLDFSPFTLQLSLEVHTRSDNIYRNGESLSFILQLSNPTALSLARTNITLFVIDNDTIPIMSASALQANEGSHIIVEFTLSKLSTITTAFSYLTSDETAMFGINYVKTQGNITFQPNTLHNNLSIETMYDNVYYGGKVLNFSVSFSSPVSLFFAETSATLQIIDADPVPQMISSTPLVVDEGSAIQLVFTQLQQSAVTGSINYFTKSNTAIGNINYANSSGTISFPPGTTTQNITIDTYVDNIYGNGTILNFTINYHDASFLSVLSDSQVLSIRDTDSAPMLTISAPESIIAGTEYPLTFSLSKLSSLKVTFHYEIMNDTAVAEDYFVNISGTVTIPSFSVQEIIYIPTILVKDIASLNFSVVISSPTFATLSNSLANLTLVFPISVPTTTDNGIGISTSTDSGTSTSTGTTGNGTTTSNGTTTTGNGTSSNTSTTGNGTSTSTGIGYGDNDNNNSTGNNDSHTGAIVGGVLGGIALIAICGLIAFLMLRKKKDVKPVPSFDTGITGGNKGKAKFGIAAFGSGYSKRQLSTNDLQNPSFSDSNL